MTAGFDTVFNIPNDKGVVTRSIHNQSDHESPIQSYSETIRSYSNYIYVLKPEGLINIYLLSLPEMARAYVERSEWLASLKLCYEICTLRMKSNKDELESIRLEVRSLLSAYVDKMKD